jgi:hypothetical protein
MELDEGVKWAIGIAFQRWRSGAKHGYAHKWIAITGLFLESIHGEAQVSL